MPICDVCGTSFSRDGYHVATGGRAFDSIECALRARGARSRPADATSLWIEAARRRLRVDVDATNVERKPPDH